MTAHTLSSVPDIAMPSLLVARVIAHVRALGADADGLIRDFDLPPTVEHDPIAVVPLRRIHALLEAAERMTDDDALGTHVAMRADGLAGIKVIEFVCSGVPDLRAALDRYVRYLASWNPVLPVIVEKTSGGTLIRQRIAGEPLCLGRHGNEHWIASMLLAAQRVTSAPCVPRRIGLAHGGPPPGTDFRQLVGPCPMDLGLGENLFEMSDEVLATPLVLAPSTVSSLLERYANFAAAERPQTGVVDGRVRAAIRERLREGLPSIGAVARTVGMSARTLQRRLADEGHSFAGLVDALRQDLARRFVKDPLLSVGEMAGRLGYADTTTFLRAFKRWTGSTPKRLRGGDPQPDGQGD